MIQVGITYVEPGKQFWKKIEVPEGSTVKDAIEHSGTLHKFPHIDLGTQKVGIFGKFVTLETPLREGDRIEIYRPITADPKTVKRRQTPEED